MSYSRGIVPSTVKIALLEGKEFEGRMIDATGKPIVKKSVVPLLRVGDQRSPRGFSILMLPAEIEKELTAETDHDGRFRFKKLSGIRPTLHPRSRRRVRRNAGNDEFE